MDIKLLEDKLHHCQENLNFVAGQLMLYKKKTSEFPKNRFTTLDKVLHWTSDFHYELCEIRQIALHEDEPRYYIRRIHSTLTGDYMCISESWLPESSLFATTTELYEYLCKRLKILLDNPNANVRDMKLR